MTINKSEWTNNKDDRHEQLNTITNTIFRDNLLKKDFTRPDKIIPYYHCTRIL